ncbi:MAG: hypothetical protein U0X91_23060 [Spirosomataceae bacterium]
MKKLSIVAVLLAVLSSCGQDKASLDKAEKEVFAIHDEVMPNMGQLMEYKGEISKEIAVMDSLLKTKAADSLQKRKEEGLAINRLLQDADEGMMNWMHAYNGDSLKALSGDEALKAMNAEKEKISAIQDKMQKGLAQAKAFLKK